ncbi:MAG: VWA domain-containing protein [Holophagales bacterium]|nr:VWA domain-containing protein [Holophagales bacterium]MYH26408.1 VWA domain-containing protein [Holophagales bacterium]
MVGHARAPIPQRPPVSGRGDGRPADDQLLQQEGPRGDGRGHPLLLLARFRASPQRGRPASRHRGAAAGTSRPPGQDTRALSGHVQGNRGRDAGRGRPSARRFPRRRIDRGELRRAEESGIPAARRANEGDRSPRRRGTAAGGRAVGERPGVQDPADQQVGRPGGATDGEGSGAHPERAHARRPVRVRDGSHDPQTRAPFRRRGLRPADWRPAVDERHRRAEVATPNRPKQGARVRFLIVGFAAVALAGHPSAGQDVLLPDLFTDTIDVRVVNVEVVVTDPEGYRILGLEASDFELLVDGQPVAVTYFTEVDDGRAIASFEEGRPPASLEARARNVPLLTLDEPVGTNFLVFMDQFSVVRRYRERVLDRLTEELHLLRPDDRVAIVAFDGSNVSLLLDWTNSRGDIENVLHQARPEKARLSRILVPGPTFRQTERALMAATATVRSFAGARGRKVMLLLADEWYVQDLRSYDSLIDAANLVGYTLYPIVRYARYGQHRLLADETGGLTVTGTKPRDILGIVLDDVRYYYWLGFEPPRDEDDALHDIEVRVVGRPDLRVWSRLNYLDMSRGAEVTMLVEGSLLFGGTPGIDSLEVQFGTPERAGFRRVTLPMEVTIPLDDVTLLPMGGKWMNELELRVSVINEHGDRSETPVSRIPILGSSAPLPGDYFVYETELLIRRREHRYIAAVYDPLTGAILSASGTIGSRR